MDFDDNDFQGQSFQLGGEDNKFPSSLRSFTLPKYDFDENLQVHLGFNGLDDTEDLLGIQNQQHSHWIEDFSRSSTRIDFDSSAPESCCISRHNNVWSEATSSESVEMLLKSVGQDEVTVKEVVLEESIGGDEFKSLKVQMDNNSNESEGLSLIDTGPALPPDKSVAQFTSSSDDVESQPSVPISEGKGNCSEYKVAVGPSVGTNCASIQNLSSANSLTDAMEDGADCGHHSNMDMVANIGSANVDASEVKMHFLESNSAVDEVVSNRNEKIIGKEKHIGKTYANSMEDNKFAENSEESLSFEREERSVKTNTCHGPSEVHISEKHELPDAEQRGESGIISSVIVEVQAEDDSTTRNNKTSSVVKVFSPADLIQVPSEMKKVIKNYNDSELGAGETISSNLSHLHGSDKLAESDTDLTGVIKVPKNVLQQEHSIIDQVGRNKTSHFVETNSGNTLSCKETDEMALTTEVKSYIESKGTQILLPQIDVGVPEDSIEERTVKKSDPVDNSCSTNSQVVDVCLVENSDVLCSSPKAVSFISECDKTVQTPPEANLPLVPLEAETADRNFKGEPQPSGEEDHCNELTNTSVGSEGKDALGILPLHFKEKETNDGEETSIVDEIGEKTVDVEVHNSSSDVGLNAQNANEIVSESGQDGKRAKSDPVVAENVCGAHASEAGNTNFNEETCGSPIAISSQEQVQNDKDIQCCDSKQQEQIVTVLDGTHVDIPVTDKPFDNLKLMSDDPVEAEKSFAFEGKVCVKESISHHNGEVQEPKVDTALSKNTRDDKGLQASSGGTLKRTNTRGRVLKESSSRKRKAESVANLSRPSTNSAENASQFDPLSSIQQYACTDGNNAKSTSATTCLAFNLPDLNSADSPALLHQPFTDLQQVQLRAQIFVYGSLIQGTAPDEACMFSAFGDCSQDGGKSMWESVWKLAVERFYSQKSPVTGLESPLYAQSGGRSAQDKTSTFESGRRSSLFPSAISPAIHLSSSLWSAVSQPQDAQCSSAARNFSSDTHQSLSPLFPFQFPQMHYRGNTPVWPSQASTAGSPWMAPVQRTFLDTGQGYTALSIAEAVQATPAREISTNSTVKPLSTTLTSNDGNRTPPLSSTKSRKRRKKSVEESVQISPINPLSGLVSLTSNVLSTFTPTSSKVVPCKKPSSSPVSSSHFQIVPAGVDAGRKAIFTEQTQSRIEQAKFQAEDAACHASSAARHCQDIWTQLSVKNNSGSVLDTEEKLSSAAVAAAAGVSVAKAAAAAAKIALEAVVQAKLMIDEALKHEGDASFQIGHVGSSNMNVKDKSVHNKSIISATREAAQRRVEDTSAAAKRAENLDAIVKAAELALEAVGQTGTIIAMGDPVPLKLKELLESGMHGYWKLHSMPSERKMAPNKVCQNDEHLDANDALVVCGGNQHLLGETPHIEVENATNNNSSGENIQQSQNQYDAGKAMGNSIGSGAGPESSFSKTAFDSSKYNIADGSKGSYIVEGSHVEVVRKVDESRGVWHLAKVLIVKDEEAFVCYDELPNEGSDQLKEWIPLRGIGDEPPRIRNAQGDDAALKYEGTRKRRRAAIGNNSWCIGDQVDVRMHSCWRTAMVTEKDKADVTKLTVQFLDDKIVSVVQTWDLRPSLVWNNGRWVEWSKQSNYRSSEGDSPLEKRQKLGRQETGAQSLAAEKKSISKEPVVENLAKFEGSWAHMLTEKDKIFTIGKETEKQPKTGTLKMKRTGLQKEESKVIFGIPKPGKRRKFMDVSKHYVTEKRPRPDKSNEITDSTKLVKYLMPQGSSRNWKNAPKADFRGKQVSENISRVPKSGKLHSKLSKPSSETEISSISVTQVSMHNAKRSASLEETADKNQPSLAVVSLLDDRRTSAPVDLSSDALSSQKVSNVGANKGGKGKLGATGKVPGGQEKRFRLNYPPPSSNANLSEPRRSNRRIQPTSRLLEGLQSSSLTVAKMPSVSLDKGAKSFSRSSSSR